MNHPIVLIARREILQILKMRSFWFMLLVLPAAIGAGQLFWPTLDQTEPTKIVLVDRSANESAEAVKARFQADRDRSVLHSLSRHVRRYELEHADLSAPWAQHDRWYTDGDIAAFRAAGGVDAAIAKISDFAPDGTPEYDLPPARYEFIEAPAELTSANTNDFSAAAEEILQASADDSAAKPDIIVLISEAYPTQPRVGVWTADRPRTSFMATLQDVLTVDLRQQLLERQGVDPSTVSSIQSAVPAFAINTPPPGDGLREAMRTKSFVPILLSYILMASLMISGSWMLQGSVEERSNKLLESLLACVKPEELMYGKLIGGVAVGLLMLVVWSACAGFAAFAFQGAISDLIGPALEPIASPGIIAAILFFFVAGYVAISIIFVAIGGAVDTVSSAQGYMMPIVLLIMLPFSLLLPSVATGQENWLVHALTWLPLWTPFAVLARLGNGIEVWEIIGSGVILSAAIVLEIIFLGRLFRASLLASGQNIGLKQLLERFRKTAS